jgi:2-oxoglutarate ferredoxin oxidoreductase, gamma subunit (EC 1.2.7.3)
MALRLVVVLPSQRSSLMMCRLTTPKATKVDALLALTQEACDKYSADLKDSGILLYDTDLVTKLPEGGFKKVGFNIINTAKNEVGREIVANIVALGAMIALTGVVSRENGLKAVLSRVPEAFLELNEKAYAAGFDKAKAAAA